MEDNVQISSSEEKFPVLIFFLTVALSFAMPVGAFYLLKSNIGIFGNNLFVNVLACSLFIGAVVALVGLIRKEYVVKRALVVSAIYLIATILFVLFVVKNSDGRMLFKIYTLPYILSNLLVSSFCVSSRLMKAVVVVLVLLFVLSAIVSYFFFNYKSGPGRACGEGGGTWTKYSSGCADDCFYLDWGGYVCSAMGASGCDCGSDACWTGEKCISDEEYLNSQH